LTEESQVFDIRDHYRELSGLLLLVALGLAVWLGRGFFTPPEVSPETSAFSLERTEADKAYTGEDWASAEDHYRALTERDPFNGYAWYSLGDCLWQQARQLFSERDRTVRAIVQDPDRLEELRTLTQKLGEEAVACFSRAADTGRIRILARQRIAEVYTALGERGLAVEVLVQCYEDGMTTRSLRNIAAFAPLRGDPGFEELMRRDSRGPNRGGNPPSATGDEKDR
jgi:hypothetical protein